MKIVKLVCLDCFEEDDGEGLPYFDIDGVCFDKDLIDLDSGKQLTKEYLKGLLRNTQSIDLAQCKQHEDYSKLEATFSDGMIIKYDSEEILNYLIKND